MLIRTTTMCRKETESEKTKTRLNVDTGTEVKYDTVSTEDFES
jgi:hypothetical protein